MSSIEGKEEIFVTKDNILSDINILKEKVSNTSTQLSFLKDTEKDYWNKLLDSNIRAGTMACMWCIKTQIVKKTSLAFNRWKIYTASRSFNSSMILGYQINNDVNEDADALVAAMKLLHKYKDPNISNSSLINSFSETKDNSNNEQKRNILLALSRNIISKLNKSPSNNSTGIVNSHIRRSPSVGPSVNRNDTTVSNRTSLSLLKGHNRRSNSQSPPRITYGTNPTMKTNKSTLRSNSVDTLRRHSNNTYRNTEQQLLVLSSSNQQSDRYKNLSNSLDRHYDIFNEGNRHTNGDNLGRFLLESQDQQNNQTLSPSSYKNKDNTNTIYIDHNNHPAMIPTIAVTSPHPLSYENPYYNQLNNRSNSAHKNIPRYLQATRSAMKKTNASPIKFNQNIKKNSKTLAIAPFNATAVGSVSMNNSSMLSSISYPTKIQYDLNTNISMSSNKHNNTSHRNDIMVNDETTSGISKPTINAEFINHSTSENILFGNEVAKYENNVSVSSSSIAVFDKSNTENNIQNSSQELTARSTTLIPLHHSISPNQAHGSIYNYMNGHHNSISRMNTKHPIQKMTQTNDHTNHTIVGSSSITNHRSKSKQNKKIDKAQLKLFYGDLSEDQLGNSKHMWTRNLRK